MQGKSSQEIFEVTTGIIGGAAGAIEQLARPDLPKAVEDIFFQVLTRYTDKVPWSPPIVNPLIDMWKQSGAHQTYEVYVRELLNDYVQRSKK